MDQGRLDTVNVWIETDRTLRIHDSRLITVGYTIPIEHCRLRIANGWIEPWGDNTTSPFSHYEHFDTQSAYSGTAQSTWQYQTE